MNAEAVIEEVVKLCKSFGAKEVVLYGSRAKGTALERDLSDSFVLSGTSAKFSITFDLTHDYDCEIVKEYCKTIVGTYIDLLYTFKNTVNRLLEKDSQK